MADIFAADEQKDIPVELEPWVKLACNVLDAQGVRPGTEVSLLFVDETTIAELNQRFLGKSGPTDVLSFPIDEEAAPGGRYPDQGGTGPGGGTDSGPEELPMMLGDVLICPTVAKSHASDHEVSLEDEIALLVVHGMLHLLGMDHIDEAEAVTMEARERELLAMFHKATSDQSDLGQSADSGIQGGVG